MKEINYTFIIPHHNCPDLLDRCLSSIPQRDDIQIIVVDDNSDENRKPVECGRPEVEYIYIDKATTKGAGRARNIGMAKAEGKWLLFPDSDDFYNKDFIKVLDLYKDKDIDVLYFNFTFIDGESGDILPKTRIQETIDIYVQSKKDEETIRYKNNSPWSKMVRCDFVKQTQAYYEEVPNGNDILFSLWIGYEAKKIEVNGECLYNYMMTPNSLGTKKQSANDLICRLTHLVKHNAYNNYLDHKEWNINPLIYTVSLIRQMKLKDSIAFIMTLIFELPSLIVRRKEWIDIIFNRN